MAQLVSWPWQMYAVIFSAVALGGFVWVNFGRPWMRERIRRRPVHAHFCLRPETPGHSYVIHDDVKHDVRTLVLPSNSEVEIEVGYFPVVPFKLSELIFGCDGDNNSKPCPAQLIDRFGGGETFTPGKDKGHYIDIHKFYHWQRETHRSKGTHYVCSYRLSTRAPGTYTARLSYLTDEIEGNYELSILVEDQPKTRMKCIRHSSCYVRPRARSIE